MSYIPEQLRRFVMERASYCCEYCLIGQEDYIWGHEVDHIIAEKHRGKTSEENLCYSCLNCNRHKGSDFASFDPETDEVAFLFNPRRDKWNDHFRLEGARIIPLTPQGRVTVFLLDLNNDEILDERELLIKSRRYPCK
ncbi:MAG: hypothetical protein BroJett018_02980 [Chloroflexota bacterium]|nr:HNH endonuclease [Chloroflexota bacterium]NOG61908.1 HNH endonuclease [Chloroflexota bacterium]GIK62504.1 MAG: hypothetical protein BroJett018_02980 [Chloroflexota bacterium]